jgi:hypothetical protein
VRYRKEGGETKNDHNWLVTKGDRDTEKREREREKERERERERETEEGPDAKRKQALMALGDEFIRFPRPTSYHGISVKKGAK